METKNDILKKYFGHSLFRNGQEQIVDCLLSHNDALCIMPTGAGKSICYQIPALLFDGVTIVISPLISLMKDQVNALCQFGVAAAYLNSSLSYVQYNKALQNMTVGKYKILYVAPERLNTPEFLKACEMIKISMIAVDESHCVSQWGQDFRPSYLKIAEFVEQLPVRPVIGAFTATATDVVKTDIIKILKLKKPLVITTGFDRPNLFFSVVKPKSKPLYLLELLSERREKSGIIYCLTRKTVEDVCSLLNEKGYCATRYHAGLSDKERKDNQDDFVFDRKTIMVATNAFGMGIDKSNVAYVIHYNMPKDIESYYQEAGRAGRDGAESDCILFYNPQDVRINKFLIEKSESNNGLSDKERKDNRNRDLERLKYMTFYCTTNDCLRHYILKYFGDTGKTYCGKCSNCLTKFETVDITVNAQKILSCIVKTGQHFGKKMICDILRGSKNERLLSFGLNNQSTYGIMKETSEKRIRDIIDYLTQECYLRLSGDEYPVLKLTPTSTDILYGKVSITMKIAKDNHQKNKPIEYDLDSRLLSILKELRLEIAKKQSVPAYVIFPDAALVDMCLKLPQSTEEFLDISGVGKTKLERYGPAFINVIIEYTTNHGQMPIVEIDKEELAYQKVQGVYASWSEAEIAQMKSELKNGLSIEEIANIHDRTVGAIRSRIKKEGL